MDDDIRLVSEFMYQEELLAACEKEKMTKVIMPKFIPVDVSRLPYTTTEDEIEQFLGIKAAKVMVIRNEYRKPSGDARVWVTSDQEAEKAVAKNGCKLGTRTIGVKKAISKELNLEKLLPSYYYLKLTRLPWSVKEKEIIDFLFGSTVTDVTIDLGEDERPNGEATVGVKTFACVENALKFQKQEIGNRNIDIATLDGSDKPHPYNCNISQKKRMMEEIMREKQSGGAPSSSSNTSNSKVLDLTSLPWSAKESDIKSFLNGVAVEKVLIVLNEYKKPSGEARVWVRSAADAEKAVKFSGQKLKDRTVTVKEVKSDQWKGNGSKTIRMASLPWTVTEKQISDLFFGSKVVSIEILMDATNRPSGEANVIMKSLADVENGLKYHKQLLGSRNVNISQM